MDFTPLTDTELDTLIADATAERDHRQKLRSLREQAASVNRSYLTAQGVDAGDPWRQPTGAHDAYPLGFVVTHNDTEWESLVAANVWEPGVSGWRQLTETVAPWVQPTGAHDAYNIGDTVTHQGQVWQSDVAANVWEPGVYGWSLTAEQ